MKLIGNDGEAFERSRAMMERQLDQLVRLVDDLLDVSRISRGKIELRRETVDLATVIRQAVETSLPLIQGNGHTLHVQIPSSGVHLHADVTRLEPGVLEPAEQRGHAQRAGGPHLGRRGDPRRRGRRPRPRHGPRHRSRGSARDLRHVHAGRFAGREVASGARHRAVAREGARRDARRIGPGAQRGPRDGKRVRGAAAARAGRGRRDPRPRPARRGSRGRLAASWSSTTAATRRRGSRACSA